MRKGDFKFLLVFLVGALVIPFQSHRVRKGDFKVSYFLLVKTARLVSISSSEKRGF